MITFTITLTPKQTEALQAEFGATVNLQTKTQAWVNDWMVQFVRNLENTQQRELFEALTLASPADAAQVRRTLRLMVAR